MIMTQRYEFQLFFEKKNWHILLQKSRFLKTKMALEAEKHTSETKQWEEMQ